MNDLIQQVHNLTTHSLITCLKRMSTKHIFTINVTYKEKILLLLLAEKLNTDAVVVEVGTFLCGSASIIAHANTNCKLFCIDTFS